MVGSAYVNLDTKSLKTEEIVRLQFNQYFG